MTLLRDAQVAAFTVVSFCVCGVGHAEWVFVAGSRASKVALYADPTTIRRTSNLVKMWAVFDFEAPATNAFGDAYQSNTQRNEYNCDTEEVRGIARTDYSGQMGSGLVVRSYSTAPSAWESIAPHTLDDALFRIACGRP